MEARTPEVRSVTGGRPHTLTNGRGGPCPPGPGERTRAKGPPAWWPQCRKGPNECQLSAPAPEAPRDPRVPGGCVLEREALCNGNTATGQARPAPLWEHTALSAELPLGSAQMTSQLPREAWSPCVSPDASPESEVLHDLSPRNTSPKWGSLSRNQHLRPELSQHGL